MPETDKILTGLKRKLYLFLKRLVHPLPFGLARAGQGAVISRPRRVQGCRYIEIGERSVISKHSWLGAIDSYAGIQYRPQLLIGNDVYIGQYSSFQCISKIVIEDNCVLSEYIYISDCAHGMDPKAGLIMHQKLEHKGDVLIQSHTFIGYRACIMPGVTLGRHCIVGANSVVTRSFPDFSMVAGVPARLIKVYSPERGEWIRAGETY